MFNDDLDEELTNVPAPTMLDWIACALALVICAVLLVAIGGGFE